jgi:hypothetical protein
VARAVEHLLNKHEALSSKTSTERKKALPSTEQVPVVVVLCKVAVNTEFTNAERLFLTIANLVACCRSVYNLVLCFFFFLQYWGLNPGPPAY